MLVLLAKPLGILVAAVAVIALIVATRGIILIPIGAVIAAVIVWRRRQASQRAEAVQQYADYQHDLAVDQQRQELFFAQDLGRLLTLSATKFEHAVGTILAANGYTHINQVGQAGDRGADIRCHDSFGRRIVVQCKRYGPDNKVTSGEMQGFLGAIRIHGGDEGLFVTTSRFTKEAASIAGAHDIALIDGAALVAMARQTPAAKPEPPLWPSPPARETTTPTPPTATHLAPLAPSPPPIGSHPSLPTSYEAYEIW